MNLLGFASVLALASPAGTHDHGHAPQLGNIAFESTCNAAAGPFLNRGLGWLHSFEYAEAQKSFEEAAAADSACGIAYWGVAMSQYHPLWAPPSKVELETGEKAIANARRAGATSDRERDYIDAIAVFYHRSDALDHKHRSLAYSAAMEALHKRYPNDREAAVFYALSLVAAGTMDQDPEFAKEKQAGAILNQVLAEEPDHPGVAHYLIHSFDYPALAELALPAAKRYSSIAPDSAHAQHMPSHIFTRLGLWEDAIKSDLKAEAAARAYASESGMPGSWDERLHAMDYLAYAYLQTGQDSKALGIWNEIKSINRADPPNLKVAYTATAVPARILLERRKWSEAAALELPPSVRSLAPLDTYKWGEAHIQFARAVGAARSGDADTARKAIAQLKALENAIVVPAGTYDWRTQVSIERQVAEAWLARTDGSAKDAEQIMRAAADLDDSAEKHPVTPGALLPAREQLGELLLEVGRPAEALVQFEASLRRAPGRLAGLYGAARAAKLAGDRATAARYFGEIAKLAKDGDRPEIREARDFAAAHAAR